MPSAACSSCSPASSRPGHGRRRCRPALPGRCWSGRRPRSLPAGQVESVLYTSLEPCPMCAVAIISSRIGRVVMAAMDEQGGSLSTERLRRLPPVWSALASLQGLGAELITTARPTAIPAELAVRLSRAFSDTREAFGSQLELDLRERVDGEVRFDPGSRATYSTDASNLRQVPIGVVAPRTPEVVMDVMAVCRAHAVPVLLAAAQPAARRARASALPPARPHAGQHRLRRAGAAAQAEVLRTRDGGARRWLQLPYPDQRAQSRRRAGDAPGGAAGALRPPGLGQVTCACPRLMR